MKLKRSLSVILVALLCLTGFSFDTVYGASKPSMDKTVSIEEGQSTQLEIVDGKFKVKKIQSVKSDDEGIVIATNEGTNYINLTAVKEGTTKVTVSVKAKKGKKSKNFKLKTEVTVTSKGSDDSYPMLFYVNRKYEQVDNYSNSLSLIGIDGTDLYDYGEYSGAYYKDGGPRTGDDVKGVEWVKNLEDEYIQPHLSELNSFFEANKQENLDYWESVAEGNEQGEKPKTDVTSWFPEEMKLENIKGESKTYKITQVLMYVSYNSTAPEQKDEIKTSSYFLDPRPEREGWNVTYCDGVALHFLGSEVK